MVNQLDLCAVMDCTGSMGSYIKQAQECLCNIVREIHSIHEISTRFAYVEYRDHPPQDDSFVTRTYPFTSSIDKMQSYINNSRADGGGDAPEAVADALHEANNFEWKQQTAKICMLITDAPPHGLSKDDNFPECPAKHDPMVLARKMAAKGITLYVIGCEPSIIAYKQWYSGIAHITGGQYIPLESAQILSKVITAGVEQEFSLYEVLPEVSEQIEAMCNETSAPVNIAELVRDIHRKLQQQGTKTVQMHYKGKPLKPSEEAVKLSEYATMAQVQENFVPFSPADEDAVEFDFMEGSSEGALGRLMTALGERIDPGGRSRDQLSQAYETKLEKVSAEQVKRMVTKLVRMNKYEIKQNVIVHVNPPERDTRAGDVPVKYKMEKFDRLFASGPETGETSDREPDVSESDASADDCKKGSDETDESRGIIDEEDKSGKESESRGIDDEKDGHGDTDEVESKTEAYPIPKPALDDISTESADSSNPNVEPDKNTVARHVFTVTKWFAAWAALLMFVHLYSGVFLFIVTMLYFCSHYFD